MFSSFFMHFNLPKLIKLISEKRCLLQIIAAGIMGFCLSLYFVEWDRISDNIPWYAYNGDRLQHMTGANYYAQDEWRFPLFDMKNIHEPEGANVVFTDSIPIIALIYKIYYKITGNFFNYFCLWLSLCFVLNAASFSFLLNKLKIDSWIVNLSSAAIVCTMPCFLMRFGHAALCGHFLLITSIAIYLICTKEKQTKYVIYSLIVCLVALLVHVYLFAMCMAIHFSIILKYYQPTKEKTRIAAISAVLSVIVSLILMVIFGHLTKGIPAGSAGYGNFSMNLLSPVWPYKSSIINVNDNMLGTLGQYEGYNYLGIGVIFILMLAIALNFNLILNKLIEHKYFIIILFLIFLYSISNKIYLGTTLILSYDIPGSQEIYKHFQSSGRFFWIIAYSILILSIIVLYKYNGRKVLLITVPFIAILHFIEFKNMGYSKYYDSGKNALFYSIYGKTVENYDKIYIYPYYHCASDNHTSKKILEMMYINSLQNKWVNNGYLARTSRKCEEQDNGIEGDINHDNSVFFFLGEQGANQMYFFPKDKLYRFPHGYVYANPELKLELFPGYYVPADVEVETTTFTPYVPVAITSGALNEQSPVKLLAGFSGLEPWGTWSVSSRSKIYIDGVAQYPTEELIVNIDFSLFINEKNPKAHVRLIHDSHLVYERDFVYNRDDQEGRASFSVKKDALKRSPIIEIHTDNNKSPYELGLSEDKRTLGIALTSIEINPAHELE